MRAALPVAIVAVLLAALAPVAWAGHAVDRFVGFGPGGLGGEFSLSTANQSTQGSPRGVAVNEGGVGGAEVGDIYVADTFNHRIEVFSAAGEFKFAFGRDVVVEGGLGDLGFLSFEKCTVALECKEGLQGGAGGEFVEPHAVAVNQATGHVYVRDRKNQRVQQFTATGDFVRAFGWDVVRAGGTGDDTTPPVDEFEICTVASECKPGTGGTGAGQFGAITASGFNGTGIAVAPAGSAAAGDVFVVDPQNRRLLRFNSDGTLDAVPTIGSTSNFGSGQPLHVAVDSAGVVYASDGNSSGQIDRYDTSTSALMTSIGASAGGASPNPLLSGSSTTATSGLAVDPDSDGAGADEDVLYVLRDPSSGNTVVQQFGPVNDPGLAAAPTASDDNTHGVTAFGTGAVNGLGVDAATGRLFVSASIGNACAGPCYGVYALDADGTAAAVGATMSPSTAISHDGATLQGNLTTPDGLVSYRFEYSKDGVVWNRFPGSRATVTGTRAVSQPVTGLDANTTYRIRIVATKVLSPTSAVSETSAELTLLTAQSAPVVTTDGARQVSATTAYLAGRVDPGGAATSYWFEWGDTLYGNQTPVPAGSAGSGGTAKAVGETLTGLVPETTYHFRLCAQNVHAPAPVCGVNQAFTTRVAVAAPAGRSYEMVTPPDKVLRQGHSGTGGAGRPDYARAQTAVPSSDGESVMWALNPAATSGNAGHGFTWAETYELYRRRDERWAPEAITNVAPLAGGSNALLNPVGASADLRTSAWYTPVELFANHSNQSVRVMGDTGGPRAAGWYPWLDPSWFSGGIHLANTWATRIDDRGERLIGYSTQSGQSGPSVGGSTLREISPVDGGGSPMSLGQLSGRSLMLSDPSYGWRPGDLINECTGTIGGQETLIPTRVADAPTDTVGARPCETGSVIEARGAALEASGHLASSAITSMSDAGDRVFFVSPDPAAPDPDQTSGPRPDGDGPCYVTTGTATECPPQLFVRQYDDSGTPTVRWLSRAEDALFDAPQEIGLFGAGVAFEGASRDGSVVYFRTNAPLTADDPNGGALGDRPVTTGSASPDSWDLYRYDLGDDNNADPAAGDPAERLTRISGGPNGDADPNTNCALVAFTGTNAGSCSGANDSGSPNGAGGAVRFMSDDGERVYFVTAAAIPGAANSPAEGGATTPTGTGHRVNVASRNLYLYDAAKSGASAYKFIARIPFAASLSDLASCASFATMQAGPTIRVQPGVGQQYFQETSCVHGTASGDAIVFMTVGQLTADDVDDAADVYVYEAVTDRLTRLSAPRAESSPYACMRQSVTATPTLRCNGDLGFHNHITATGGDKRDRIGGSAGFRHWNIAENSDGTLAAVYFESRLRLTEDKGAAPGIVEDTGGEGHMGVYEWRDGRLSLISPRDSQDSAFYSGNSRNGDHVFFWTEQRISAWEIDAVDGDLYNATAAAPQPGPPVAPPVCALLAGQCHGADVGKTAISSSTAEKGGSNATSGERAALTIGRPGARARLRAARSGVLALRVRTSRAGRVMVLAEARLRSRRGSTRVRRVALRRLNILAGRSVTVRLRLTAVARRQLAAGRALHLIVRVSQPDARARTATVVLRRAGR